jgi:syntaxin-binding protein 1
LNEYPFIRYYLPSHHSPLGPLKPNATTRPPPPPENAARWRTNLARGDQARQYESVEGDFATKLLAFMVQENLDEYKRNNPEFPVRTLFKIVSYAELRLAAKVRSWQRNSDYY